MTLDDLKDILATNPDMLERYVLEVINLETLEKWHQRKAEKLGKSLKNLKVWDFQKHIQIVFHPRREILHL